MKRWRNGEIKLVNELETSIAENVETKLKTQDTKSKFDDYIESWLKELSLEIQKDTHHICVTYGIPDATFQLELAENSVADRNMYRHFEAQDAVERKVLTMSSGIAGAVLGGIVAAFFTTSNILYWGVLEITTGGIAGWIALLAIGLFGGIYGLSKIGPLSEFATDVIKENEIPNILRRLTDKQIDQIIEKARPAFEKNLTSQFEKYSESHLNELLKAIKEALVDCANKARILIK